MKSGKLKNSKEVGNWGERKAADFLKKKGYRIIGMNYRNKFGEIDIVCAKNNTLVFVEVKTSRESEGFFPEERVN